MKNIFTTIEYVAEKIKEAITGHKNDEQAHPNLSEQINVLSREALKYIGNITTFSEVNETGYYTVAGCLDGTIPIQYGTLKAYLSGSEKTIETVGFKDNKTIQCHASYNNTKQWAWEQSATKNEINEVSNQKFIRSDANTEGRDTPTKPSEYTLGLFTNQIKTFASMGIQGSGFAHVIGVNEWTDTTAGVHELMFAGTKMYHRESISPDAWGQLYEIATTTKTDILITYNQDYEPIDTNLNKIVKNSLGEVIIYFSVKRKDGGIFSGNNLFVVGAIPVGTRPISDMGFCVLGYETGVSNFKPVGVSVYANGSVVIQTDSQVTAITGVIKYEAVR